MNRIFKRFGLMFLSVFVFGFVFGTFIFLPKVLASVSSGFSYETFIGDEGGGSSGGGAGFTSSGQDIPWNGWVVGEINPGATLLQFQTEYGLQSFQVYFSTDGVNWTHATNGENMPQGGGWVQYPIPSGAKYDRFGQFDGVGTDDGLGDISDNGTPINAPAAPTNLSYSLSGLGAVISWNDTTAASYDVYLNGALKATGITDSSYAIKGLASNTTYSVQVNGVNGAGYSGPPSNTVQFTTPIVPNAPTNLQATGGNVSQQISLSWTSVSNATGYDIYRDGKLLASNVSGTTYTDTGLTNGNTYTYFVRSETSGTESGDSNTVTAVASAPIIGSPTNVQATGTGGGGGSISWTPPPNAPSGTTYTVYNNGQPVGTTTSSPLSISNYDPNGSYTVTASAPGYASSTSKGAGGLSAPSSGYGFTASDVLSNSFGLLYTLSGFILLGLIIMFAPKLIELIRRAVLGGEMDRYKGDRDRDLGYDGVRMPQDYYSAQPFRDVVEHDVSSNPVSDVKPKNNSGVSFD